MSRNRKTELDYLNDILQGDLSNSLCCIGEYRVLRKESKRPVKIAIIDRQLLSSIGSVVISNAHRFFHVSDAVVEHMHEKDSVSIGAALIKDYLYSEIMASNSDLMTTLALLAKASTALSDHIVNKIPLMDINPDTSVTPNQLIEFRSTYVTRKLIGKVGATIDILMHRIFSNNMMMTSLLENCLLDVKFDKGNYVIINYGDVDALKYYLLASDIAHTAMASVSDSTELDKEITEIITDVIPAIKCEDFIDKVQRHLKSATDKVNDDALRRSAWHFVPPTMVNQLPVINWVEGYKRAMASAMPAYYKKVVSEEEEESNKRKELMRLVEIILK